MERGRRQTDRGGRGERKMETGGSQTERGVKGREMEREGRTVEGDRRRERDGREGRERWKGEEEH